MPHTAAARRGMSTTLLQSARCVILDFDGVIADSEEFQLSIWKGVFMDFNLPLTGLSISAIAGIQDRVAVERICPGCNATIYDEVVGEKKRRCQAQAGNIPVVGGVYLFLRQACEGKSLFICSGSSRPEIVAFLDHHLPVVQFEGIIAHGDYSNPKPHPEPYLAVLNMAGIPPVAAVAIEDSLAGIQSAQAAGMSVIHLDRYGVGGASTPAVRSFSDLL